MSTTIDCRLYSGESSEATDIQVVFDDSGWLRFPDAELNAVHLEKIEISPRIGNSMRYLVLPDGASLETRCNNEIDRVLYQYDKNYSRLHRLERSTVITVLAIVLFFGGGYLLVTRGIPAMSAFITSSLPVSLDDRLGGEVLSQLDDLVFSDSVLPEFRKQELTTLFESLIPVGSRDYQLRFRSSEFLGANAFALPDAQIIFTDQLIELSDDDQMLAAIMLHEIGHVEERHAMQAVVSQAGLSILIVALTGDVNTAATTLLILFPSFLIQSGYSRDLEWSADTYALEQMLDRGMNPGHFADIMERLTAGNVSYSGGNDGSEVSGENADTNATSDEENRGLLEYFSSHPATDQRIERFRLAAP